MELAESYYRLAAPCVPFQMTQGTPFLALIIHSPASESAKHVYYGQVSREHGNAQLAGQHTFIRLFASMGDQGEQSAICSAGCGYNMSTLQFEEGEEMLSQAGIFVAVVLVFLLVVSPVCSYSLGGRLLPTLRNMLLPIPK
jgi:hypothetical protein